MQQPLPSLFAILLRSLLLRLVFSSVTCKTNELLFMGKCWCEPGWESKTNTTLDCTVPVLQNGNCECEPNDLQRKFLTNASWLHPSGDYRCLALCRWNSQVGVPRAIPVEWKDNQFWRQLPFYKKELPQKRHNHLRGRLDEFANAFGGWVYLNNTNFGKTLELGCGGYTQLRNIMERVNVHVEYVTLLDPLIDHYLKVGGCPFSTGQLIVKDQVIPTRLLNLTIEKYGQLVPVTEKYDTVIIMNIIVYAMDAFQILETIHKVLKPNGLLIFHDRWFDDPQRSSKCKTAGFTVNVLQVSKPLLSHFLSFYSREPFFSTNQTREQHSRSWGWCLGQDNEQGFWVAGRKIRELKSNE